jgi:hypothetical protein
MVSSFHKMRHLYDKELQEEEEEEEQQEKESEEDDDDDDELIAPNFREEEDFYSNSIQNETFFNDLLPKEYVEETTGSHNKPESTLFAKLCIEGESLRRYGVAPNLKFTMQHVNKNFQILLSKMYEEEKTEIKNALKKKMSSLSPSDLREALESFKKNRTKAYRTVRKMFEYNFYAIALRSGLKRSAIADEDWKAVSHSGILQQREKIYTQFENDNIDKCRPSDKESSGDEDFVPPTKKKNTNKTKKPNATKKTPQKQTLQNSPSEAHYDKYKTLKTTLRAFKAHQQRSETPVKAKNEEYTKAFASLLKQQRMATTQQKTDDSRDPTNSTANITQVVDFADTLLRQIIKNTPEEPKIATWVILAIEANLHAVQKGIITHLRKPQIENDNVPNLIKNLTDRRINSSFKTAASTKKALPAMKRIAIEFIQKADTNDVIEFMKGIDDALQKKDTSKKEKERTAATPNEERTKD